MVVLHDRAQVGGSKPIEVTLQRGRGKFSVHLVLGARTDGGGSGTTSSNTDKLHERLDLEFYF
jgi:hypothetical protein